MNIIEIKNISKRFDVGGTVFALNNVSLDIKKGEFVTLLGPSGCGKTTLLRLIAGFEKPTEGEILFNGQNVEDIPPYKRSINTVFQKYALFPNLNVFGNIAFGLKLKKVPTMTKNSKGETIEVLAHLPKEKIAKKVRDALKMVGLSDYEKRDVTSLSGGQQQRVAIARAIVNEPEVLLLDEPLGALDLKMRKEMQLELKEIHAKLGITFIYVTHDQEEALTMSTTIVVMKDGVIQQIGTPIDIYNNPVNSYVANFIGESNIFDCIVKDENTITFADCELPTSTKGFDIGEEIEVVIRPEDIYIMDKDKNGHFEGKITSAIFKGMHYEYFVKSTNGFEVVVHESAKWDVGDDVVLFIKPTDTQLMRPKQSCNKAKAVFVSGNKIELFGGKFDVDATKLYPNYKYDENENLVDAEGNKIDLSAKDIVAKVTFDDIELVDHDNDGVIAGNIETILFKGDHYQYGVRTDSSCLLIVDTNVQWDNGDRVGINISADKIVLSEVEG